MYVLTRQRIGSREDELKVAEVVFRCRSPYLGRWLVALAWNEVWDGTVPRGIVERPSGLEINDSGPKSCLLI